MSSKIWNGEVKREPTSYDGIFKYVAPDGFKFYVGDDCFGSVVYGKEKLENPYILKSY